MQTTSGAQRNPGIDLLRGLSIILVVIHHLALRIPLMHTGLSAVFPAMLLKALNWDGGKGVKIFFVISGFLITNHTLRRWGSLGGINAIAFSMRRACRILPCLLVLLGILAALNLAGVPDFLFHHDSQTLPGAIFAALFMHLNLYEARTNYLPQLGCSLVPLGRGAVLCGLPDPLPAGWTRSQTAWPRFRAARPVQPFCRMADPERIGHLAG